MFSGSNRGVRVMGKWGGYLGMENRGNRGNREYKE